MHNNNLGPRHVNEVNVSVRYSTIRSRGISRHTPRRHPRESGDPVDTRVTAEYWIPAFAGMTMG